jgi:HK97 family phage major capsid protein
MVPPTTWPIAVGIPPASGQLPDPSRLESTALYGDLSRFVIVDRIEMQIELIPHLFDTTNNRPTGQRGLYMYFRNGSKLIDASATVVLIGLA